MAGKAAKRSDYLRAESPNPAFGGEEKKGRIGRNARLKNTDLPIADFESLPEQGEALEAFKSL